MDFVEEKSTLEELNVLSNFMMNAIANDEDVCEPFLNSRKYGVHRSWELSHQRGGSFPYFVGGIKYWEKNW